MEKSSPSTPDKAAPMKIHVKYDELSAKYASQVIVNGSTDEIFLDFSSGVLNDPSTGESILSVHTRIAMTPAGANRLLQALSQTLNRLPSLAENAAKKTTGPSASLPRLGT